MSKKLEQKYCDHAYFYHDEKHDKCIHCDKKRKRKRKKNKNKIDPLPKGSNFKFTIGHVDDQIDAE
jgi:hypothetical protein